MKKILFSILGILLMGLLSAQQVIEYPALLKPGVATLVEQNNVYTFSNGLFSAKYLKTDDNKLFFNGSPEMRLVAGDEIFTIILGDNTLVKASEMTLENLQIQNLVANLSATSYADKFPGKTLVANFSHGSLRLQWSAVLRDGSHYLRTELKITSTEDVAMKGVYPMLYTVENNGNAAPVVVGNTRGAVIASDHIFAGAETPLAFNVVHASFNPHFAVNSWVPDSWIYPDEPVPAAILNLGTINNPSTPLLGNQVTVSQGKVSVTEGGAWRFTFQYIEGTHRMNVLGVDLVNDEGEVVAFDYHLGYTGDAAANNIYTLQVSTPGEYTLRYWGETRTETITSSGSIAVQKANVFNPNLWQPTDWVVSSNPPAGTSNHPLSVKEGEVNIASAGSLTFAFTYEKGAHKLNIEGVELIKNGDVVASDYHVGRAGHAHFNNIYTLDVPSAGDYTLRYWVSNVEPRTSSGKITITGSTLTPLGADGAITLVEHNAVEPFTRISAFWSRNTTLATTDEFNVSAVVGLIAKGQKRRSFLAYHERERAVPWRSFPVYNSWYELDISINNNINPLERMLESQCIEVVNDWKTKLFDPYNVSVKAFVWDDGWDDFNSLWDFHIGFPNKFTEIDNLSRLQGAGTGAWLGPVGGYGTAKAKRLAYWNQTYGQNISNFQLSNKVYFDAFVGRCSQMVNDYDMRYFKFDGISALYEAFGPANEEDAEGILKVITSLRKKRADLFINTTVGTWASPFWFNYSDCVWRQRDDFDMMGNQGNQRERWITYRDQLVYKNFVTGSPLCPINSIMTHGLIVTKFGPPAQMPKDNSEETKNGIIKEMRAAFASGSSMVELYLDRDLMDLIGGGALWKELADCIKWHEDNKDVLPDVHWVGGNPWDGSHANIYGWAAWNRNKSVLTLRNPSGTEQSFTSTLRELFEIPSYISGRMRLVHSFDNQTNYPNIVSTHLVPSDAQPFMKGNNYDIPIDSTITFTMPPFDLLVLNGALTTIVTSIGLHAFHGEIQQNKALVSWSVKDQSNVKEYVLEQSTDGKNFVAVATIPVSNKQSYSVAVAQKMESAYYRLKMVKTIGKASFSAIINVVRENVKPAINIYPNPTTSILNIEGAQGKDYQLYDMNGKKIAKGQIVAAVHQVKVHHLASGTYVLRIEGKSYKFVKK